MATETNPAWKKRILRLHLKREYWEAIRDGRKTEEYRLFKTWSRRIHDRVFDEVHLFLGYPAAGDESRVLRRKWVGCSVQSVSHPEWGNRFESVIVIPVDKLVKDDQPAPPIGVLESVIRDVIAHSRMHPDHGLGCSCMDSNVGAIRQALRDAGLYTPSHPDPSRDWRSEANIERIFAHVIRNP